jgi:hypothetical protein
MNFQSVLVFLHMLSLALAITSFLILLRQLGMRTLSEAGRAANRFNVRITSYTMLLGLLLVCFASGALLCYQLLHTSKLPNVALLATRGLSLAGAAVGCVFLHTKTIPLLRESAGRKIVDSASASNILAATLSASFAILCWAIFLVSLTLPHDLEQWSAGLALPASAFIVLILWAMLSAFLLGERSIRELKDWALRVKKSLEPPTQIELQRANRARRMNNMNLPMAPRRKTAQA